MRRSSILDVLRAVRDVGSAHPEVRAWWYAPGRRLPLPGALAGEEAGKTLEVVVEIDDAGADLAGISGDLAARLRQGPVSVRAHQGNAEERQLYRLLSRGKAAAVPESTSGARGGG